MAKIIIAFLIFVIGNGFAVWMLSFVCKAVFNVSIEEAMLIFSHSIHIHCIINSIITISILALIFVFLLKKSGMFEEWVEKINAYAKFNKFCITPRFLAHNFVSQKDTPVFTVIAQVKNIGFNESNLTNWAFYFIAKNGKKYMGRPLYQKLKIDITIQDKQTLSFPIERALYKLTQNALGCGKSITGVVQFSIPFFSQEIFLNEVEKIVIEARDNRNKKVKSVTNVKTFLTENYEMIADLHDIAIKAF